MFGTCSLHEGPASGCMFKIIIIIMAIYKVLVSAASEAHGTTLT